MTAVDQQDHPEDGAGQFDGQLSQGEVPALDEKSAEDEKPNLARPETRAAGRWMSAGIPQNGRRTSGGSVARLGRLLARAPDHRRRGRQRGGERDAQRPRSESPRTRH